MSYPGNYNLDTRATHCRRDGKRVPIARPKHLWEHCLSEHRRDAHQGKRSESCAACREMEARAKKDGAQ